MSDSSRAQTGVVNQGVRRRYLATRPAVSQRLPAPSAGQWRPGQAGSHESGFQTSCQTMAELGIIERVRDGVYQTTTDGWQARQALHDPDDGGWYPCGHTGKTNSRDLPDGKVRCARCGQVWDREEVQI